MGTRVSDRKQNQNQDYFRIVPSNYLFWGVLESELKLVFKSFRNAGEHCSLGSNGERSEAVGVSGPLDGDRLGGVGPPDGDRQPEPLKETVVL